MENKYIAGIDPIENLPDSTSVTYTLPPSGITTIGYNSFPITVAHTSPFTTTSFGIYDFSTGEISYIHEKDYSNLTTLGLIEECLTLIDKL